MSTFCLSGSYGFYWGSATWDNDRRGPMPRLCHITPGWGYEACHRGEEMKEGPKVCRTALGLTKMKWMRKQWTKVWRRWVGVFAITSPKPDDTHYVFPYHFLRYETETAFQPAHFLFTNQSGFCLTSVSVVLVEEKRAFVLLYCIQTNTVSLVRLKSVKISFLQLGLSGSADRSV